MERMERIDLVSSWAIRARDATPPCGGASAPRQAEAAKKGERIQDRMLEEGWLGRSAQRQDAIAGLASTISSSGRAIRSIRSVRPIRTPRRLRGQSGGPVV